MFLFAILAILAFGDIGWAALFSGIALIAAAWIARPLRATVKKIDAIDRAVNDQDKGMPTLVGRIITQDDLATETAAELAEFRLWTQDALTAFAKAQGVVLPEVPEPVEPKPAPAGDATTTK